MTSYDVSGTGSVDAGIFGLPTPKDEAHLIIIPIPWDATASYGGGSCDGPEAILNASPQLDLFHLEWGRPYEMGIHMLPISKKISSLNRKTRLSAQKVMRALEKSSHLSKVLEAQRVAVNQACEKMNSWVETQVEEVLKENKIFIVLGGDHSTPLKAIEAIGKKYNKDFGVLHIDAHADLRCAYQGFKYSHASIMYNVMNSRWAPQKLVQVGIRDFCEEEYNYIREHSKISTYFDLELQKKLFEGTAWKSVCDDIIQKLPQNVYVSFDIDGLDPSLCPHTGTPVPGGLSYAQATYLLSQIPRSGRRVVGCDLNEVSPAPKSEWDGNVGARLLYHLCGVMSHRN